jgi:hypothetical protein
MVMSKQHLHPRCFIDMSTPLRLGCSGLAGATLKKKLPGNPSLFRLGLYARSGNVVFRNLHRSDLFFRFVAGRTRGQPEITIA